MMQRHDPQSGARVTWNAQAPRLMTPCTRPSCSTILGSAYDTKARPADGAQVTRRHEGFLVNDPMRQAHAVRNRYNLSTRVATVFKERPQPRARTSRTATREVQTRRGRERQERLPTECTDLQEVLQSADYSLEAHAGPHGQGQDRVRIYWSVRVARRVLFV